MEQKRIDEIKERWSGSRWGESFRGIADEAVVDIPFLLEEIDRYKVWCDEKNKLIIKLSNEGRKANDKIDRLTERNEDLQIALKNANAINRLTGKDKAELAEYREATEGMTIDELRDLMYLRKRYEDETYDFCGEYGTEECQLAAHQEARMEGRVVIIPPDSNCGNCLLLCGDCGTCMRYGYSKDTRKECAETIAALGRKE